MTDSIAKYIQILKFIFHLIYVNYNNTSDQLTIDEVIKVMKYQHHFVYIILNKLMTKELEQNKLCHFLKIVRNICKHMCDKISLYKTQKKTSKKTK